MKNRLTTLDIVCLIKDLEKTLVGMRVDRIYDIDKKTYLIRFSKTDSKKILLLESGVRFHTTSFEWPKNPAPSGFSMKLRKHLNNKRLEKITQLGADRIVDLEFGTQVFTNHILLELYDKGNIVLTDHEYKILSVLRPHVQGEDRFAAHERYAIERAKDRFIIDREEINELLEANAGKTLREIFLSKLEFGPALFSHALKLEELTPQMKIPALKEDQSLLLEKFYSALEIGKSILTSSCPQGGFITLSSATSGKKKGAKEPESQLDQKEENNFYDQFHPSVILSSYVNEQKVEFASFDEAVDDFFSKIESQKLDMKKLSQEKEAFKKLAKVKTDQQKRLHELKEGQEIDKIKAELITVNRNVVENAIAAIRQMIANQISWDDIWEQIQDAKKNGDHLASTITGMNLHRNHFSMQLSDPYNTEDEGPVYIVDIDLGLSAFSNATKYYDSKKASAKKEERTIDSQEKAFKSSEKKTKATLKEVEAIHSIKKARKVFWFEKFLWFISSENYLVLCGRDSHQNALLVSKYMKPKDVYLHADAHGAPTVIIKNDNPSEVVPPKTLNEAGCYAISYSGSWDSKIIAAAYYVYGEQVSRSAPTGEYLPAGSFMIYGKKNYLPPCQLVLGFGFLFRLTDECLDKHKNDRPRRPLNLSEEDLSKAGNNKSVPVERTSISEAENDNASTDDESQGSDEFPDTQVNISVVGASNKVRTRIVSLSSETSSKPDIVEVNEEGEEPTLIVCNTQPMKAIRVNKQKPKKNTTEKGKGGKPLAVVEEIVTPKDSPQHGNKGEKRGQHGRKKKLKEKYKFQDEEERFLRMQLLKGSKAGTAKGNIANREDSTSKRTDSESNSINTTASTTGDGDTTLCKAEDVEKTVTKVVLEADESKEKEETASKREPQEEFENEEEEQETAESELDLLNTLTGMPKEDDELLFAVPVIAPYSSLQSYKFKIKMIPGTAKRGKAARTAWQSFLRDKNATQREKDLFKSVKDQDLSRNFPGNVKLSGVDKSKH